MSANNLNQYIDSKVNAYREIEYNVSESTFKSYIEEGDEDAIRDLARMVIEPETDNPNIEKLLNDPDVSQWIDQQNTTGDEVGFCKRYGIGGSGFLLAEYITENGY